MSIAWKPFEAQVASYMKKLKANKLPPPPPMARKNFANKVISEYDKVIQGTTDLFYRNGVMRTNTGLFKIMFKAGLDILERNIMRIVRALEFTGKRLTLYSFRHSYAIRRVTMADIFTVQRELGHKSTDMTQKYLRFPEQ